MIKIIKYTPEKKQEWDNFVSNSKNGTFLFYRNYMEYHSDRFKDYSLMLYNEDRLLALFPANLDHNTLYSHQGLTYGGILYGITMKTALMLDCFSTLKTYAKENNIQGLIYKRIPHIYHRYPAEEDLYALFRNDAKLIRRDISSTIYLKDKIPFNTLRKRMLKKANIQELIVEEEETPKLFYPILKQNLNEKHHTSPVHTQEELNYLKRQFPNHIKFYIALNKDEKALAGLMVFELKNTIHVQYISSLEEGRQVGALEAIFNELINNTYKDKIYFDFGISTENQGQSLNEGLMAQKEMFGGRGICYDTYEISI